MYCESPIVKKRGYQKQWKKLNKKKLPIVLFLLF
jgi:hypothetical protein